jgi:hypothetical protein
MCHVLCMLAVTYVMHRFCSAVLLCAVMAHVPCAVLYWGSQGGVRQNRGGLRCWQEPCLVSTYSWSVSKAPLSHPTRRSARGHWQDHKWRTKSAGTSKRIVKHETEFVDQVSSVWSSKINCGLSGMSLAAQQGQLGYPVSSRSFDATIRGGGSPDWDCEVQTKWVSNLVVHPQCNWCNTVLTQCNTRCNLVNLVQHSAAQCNTVQPGLQPGATQCNTVQHSATRCNTVTTQSGWCNTVQRQPGATQCNTRRNLGATWLQHSATFRAAWYAVQPGATPEVQLLSSNNSTL